MADAVKVIDGAIAAFGAEPVAWTDEEELRDAKVAGIGYLFGIDKDANKFADPRRQIMLYRHAQPAPRFIPPELTREEYRRRFMMEDNFDDTYRGGWKACRAAMLQAGNSPVIGIDLASEPDRSVEVRHFTPPGYVMVPVEPTMAMLDEFDSIIDYGTEDSKDAWSRLIAAAPKQEAK
ncbi:hypothetical protein RQL60_14555 [Citrobacter europaeus]|uniref:hypothetical protein n=1 Tax=Citrobacter europaeus TaxID=1914243 RepID=UPI0028BEC15C|nr:hypothetical protein [Citrobacter europaeus]MDT7086215.1 hypothetical protein [Citrobacter europaeus]